MTARSFSFLINPLSGGGAAPAAVVPVARILRDAGASVDVTYSPGPQATLDIVDAAVERGDVVVSVGGDGMLSSIAGRVSAGGGTLGVIPAGRGNDFARMLGMSAEPADVAQVLLEGTLKQIDLISLSLNGAAPRIVAGSVYTGVDAIAGEVVDRVRWLPRKLQYPYAAVRSIATYRPVQARIVVDGEAREVAAANVVIANSAYYGSGMKIAPNASVDDGLLEVVIIEAASRRALLRSMPKVYDGAHVELDAVTVLRGRTIEISGDQGRGSGHPVPMGGDGEPLGHLPAPGSEPARIEVLPGALSLLV